VTPGLAGVIGVDNLLERLVLAPGAGNGHKRVVAGKQPVGQDGGGAERGSDPPEITTGVAGAFHLIGYPFW